MNFNLLLESTLQIIMEMKLFYTLQKKMINFLTLEGNKFIEMF